MDEDTYEKYKKFKKDLHELKWYDFLLLLLISPFALIYVWFFEDEESNNK